jgi:hypothetical protein
MTIFFSNDTKLAPSPCSKNGENLNDEIWNKNEQKDEEMNYKISRLQLNDDLFASL